MIFTCLGGAGGGGTGLCLLQIASQINKIARFINVKIYINILQ